MRWNGNLEQFCRWCLESEDPEEFQTALRSVPDNRWLEVERCLAQLQQRVPPYVRWSLDTLGRDAVDPGVHDQGEPPVVMTPELRSQYRTLNLFIGERVRRQKVPIGVSHSTGQPATE